MFVTPFVLWVRELNPDFILADLNGERLKIVAFEIEAAATFEIEYLQYLDAGIARTRQARAELLGRFAGAARTVSPQSTRT